MKLARDFLGKLKWTDKLKGSEIVILHRGAPRNRKVLPAEDITEIKKGHFCYRDMEGRETFIPMHRVLEIRMHGKVVWKRKASKAGLVRPVKRVKRPKRRGRKSSRRR